MSTSEEIEAAKAQADAKEFFTAPYFAVTGASTNADKFGHKVFAWYIRNGFHATPINPGAPEVKVDEQPHATISDVSALSQPVQTALSIITRPEITLKTLQKAKELGIQKVWLQPDTFDDEVLAFARAEFKTSVAGNVGSIAHDGWCVLVDGQSAASAAGKKFKL